MGGYSFIENNYSILNSKWMKPHAYSLNRVRAPFHESNIRLYKTKIMTKNKTS